MAAKAGAGGRKSSGDNNGVDDFRDCAALSHGAHSAAEIVSAERIILEGTRMGVCSARRARPIARHAMALFLNAAGDVAERRTVEVLRDVRPPPFNRKADQGVGVGRQGFHLGIALSDSVHVRKGLSGIAVGGRGIQSRNSEAWDCRRRRVGVDVGDGRAPRRWLFDAWERGDGAGVRGRRPPSLPRSLCGVGGRRTPLVFARRSSGPAGSARRRGGVREGPSLVH